MLRITLALWWLRAHKQTTAEHSPLLLTNASRHSIGCAFSLLMLVACANHHHHSLTLTIEYARFILCLGPSQVAKGKTPVFMEMLSIVGRVFASDPSTLQTGFHALLLDLVNLVRTAESDNYLRSAESDSPGAMDAITIPAVARRTWRGNRYHSLPVRQHHLIALYHHLWFKGDFLSQHYRWLWCVFF